jgi:hypothetical protein
MLDISMDWSSAYFTGRRLETFRRTLGELGNFFRDRAALQQMQPSILLYEVQSYQPCRKRKAVSSGATPHSIRAVWATNIS